MLEAEMRFLKYATSTVKKVPALRSAIMDKLILAIKRVMDSMSILSRFKFYNQPYHKTF